MGSVNVFDVNYDYELALLFSDSTETLICGSAKTLTKALINSENPNLSVKGLDIIFREQPLGSFAVDACLPTSKVDEIEEIYDRLYANLIDKNTTGKKVAEPLAELDKIYKIEENNAVRLLALTVTRWYSAAANLYMNARYGLGLKPKDRALLGEQFRADVRALIIDEFTTLKKKKSPQDREICNVIRADMRDISALLLKYYRFLNSRKIFLNTCKQCSCIFLSGAKNTQYCEDCRSLKKRVSKETYLNKCSKELRNKRQRIKFKFENFIHKNRFWDSLSEEFQAEYQALRKEFVKQSAELLRRYEFAENEGMQDSLAELEDEIIAYLEEMDSRRKELEQRYE